MPSSSNGHVRAGSTSFLTTITHPIATIFTSPKVSTQAVFLDDEEAKLGESSETGSKGAYKRVELIVGGMTVCLPGYRRERILLISVRSLCCEYRRAVAEITRNTLGANLLAGRERGGRV